MSFVVDCILNEPTLPSNHLVLPWHAVITIMVDGMTREGELLRYGGEGVLHREIIWGSMYLKFLNAKFKQILGHAILWKYGVKFVFTLGIIWGKGDSKISRKFVCIPKF